MTDKQIVETLAGKVMGWRKITTTKSNFGGTITCQHWWDASLPDPDDEGLWHGYAPHDYPRPTAYEKWDPLTDANATLECLGRFERWELTEPGACQVWRDGKCFFEYDETPLRSACRAMIAAVEGRDE